MKLNMIMIATLVLFTNSLYVMEKNKESKQEVSKKQSLIKKKNSSEKTIQKKSTTNKKVIHLSPESIVRCVPELLIKIPDIITQLAIQMTVAQSDEKALKCLLKINDLKNLLDQAGIKHKKFPCNSLVLTDHYNKPFTKENVGNLAREECISMCEKLGFTPDILEKAEKQDKEPIKLLKKAVSHTKKSNSKKNKSK